MVLLKVEVISMRDFIFNWIDAEIAQVAVFLASGVTIVNCSYQN